MSRKAIEHRLKTGAWAVAEYGVYRIGGTPITWQQRVLAACLAGPAVASHRSAARLWGFAVDGHDQCVEVTAVRHRRRHVSDVRWHESQRLEDRYVTEVDRVPVTTPVRTIVDLGVVLDVDALEETLNSAMRLRLISTEGIERALDDLGGLRPGRANVRTALLRRRDSGRTESVLETRFLQLLRAADLSLPIPQYVIREPSGRYVARVDFAYPERMLIIELDGARWHSIDIDRARDEVRDRRILALGHRLERFTWRDVQHAPDQVVAKVRAWLGEC